MWSLRGSRAEIPAAGANRKICVYGALNFKTGQVHYLIHERKNSIQFHEFLRQLLESKQDRLVVLVLDNASYHATAQILELLAEHADHVFALWLPKYSPELNAIEGLWGYLKRCSLNNYFFGQIETLEKAIHDTFAALNRHPSSTLSLAYKPCRNLCKCA